MLVINKSKEEGFFGDYQKIVSIIYFTIAQLALHGPVFILLYTAVTLDPHLIVGLLVLVIVQLPLRRSQIFIDLVNKFIQPIKYFNSLEVIYEETVTQTDRCLFGVHPHSVIGLSLLLLMNSMKEGPLSRIVGLSSRFILNFPVTGAILKLWGLQAVNHKNLRQLMKKGKNLGILPGGFEEATITSPD
jgi:2-acylglycerol O-acyltransferase 2